MSISKKFLNKITRVHESREKKISVELPNEKIKLTKTEIKNRLETCREKIRSLEKVLKSNKGNIDDHKGMKDLKFERKNLLAALKEL